MNEFLYFVMMITAVRQVIKKQDELIVKMQESERIRAAQVEHYKYMVAVQQRWIQSLEDSRERIVKKATEIIERVSR